MLTPSPPNRWFVIELVAATAATAVAVFLHYFFMLEAGALWRDESGLVGLATLPRWQDVWTMLTHDSFPIVFPALIRLWHGAGWGDSDLGYRGLGFLAGLLLPASFWMACRLMRRGVPLLPLSLVALNFVALRTGDSLRAYGLGCALNVLVLALIWRVAEKPQRWNIFLAAATAVFSVNCLYQNAFFVLAACLGGFAVCAGSRRWRDAGWVLAVGLIAAASLLPYLGPLQRSQSWWILQKLGFALGPSWVSASFITGFPFSWCNWLWVALCLSAPALTLTAILARPAPEGRDLNVFSTVALWTGILGFYAFLKLSDLSTPPWYFLPLMAFAAACLDGCLATAPRWFSPLLSGFAWLACVAACWHGTPAIKVRQTNIDLAAAMVAAQAATNDYVIVNPWAYGVSFNRYYHGVAPWTTVPPLADHVFHRYDLFKQRMQEDHPLQSVVNQLQATLQAGHRVWLVGGLNTDTQVPADIGPAPGAFGWHEIAYDEAWGAQIAREILRHAAQGVVFTNLTSTPVNPFEKANLAIYAGWKDVTNAPPP